MRACSTAPRAGLSLTEAGRAFHERCVQLLADLEEAEASAGRGDGGAARDASGVVRRELRHAARRARGRRCSWRSFRTFASTSSSPIAWSTWSTRASTLPCASGPSAGRTSWARRIGDTRLVCCAAPAYLARPRRAARARRPGAPCVPACTSICPSAIRGRSSIAPRNGGHPRDGSCVRQQRSLSLSAPARSRRGTSLPSPISSSEPRFARGAWWRSCVAPRPRPRAGSMWCMQAGGTCPRKCARSPTSSWSAFKSPDWWVATKR